MNPEQTQTVLTTLARIDERQESIKEIIERHETALSDVTAKGHNHDTKFARMKGGMTVMGILFTGLLAMVGLEY